MKIEDRLRQHFSEQAETAARPAPGVDVLIRRARRRRNLMVVSVAAVSVAVIVGGSLAFTGLENPTGDVADEVPEPAGPEELQWQVEPVPSLERPSMFADAPDGILPLRKR